MYGLYCYRTEKQVLCDRKIMAIEWPQTLNIFCVDGDGLNELIVAYTDRVVQAYRWCSSDDSSSTGKSSATATLTAVDKWLLTGQVLAANCSNREVQCQCN